MIKNLFLTLSTVGWAQRIALNWPPARKFARRFIAGETIDEALALTKQLNGQGIAVTIDYLGESVKEAQDTLRVVKMYESIIGCIIEQNLHATVSLKLTHLGFDISPEVCFSNLCQILTLAKQGDVGVTIDMESSDYTESTLEIYRRLRDEHGFKNLGTVIQAYLYRSEKDMYELTCQGAHIRLCKGAYLEPPTIAYPSKSDVDENFVRLMKAYFMESSDSYLAIATHDEKMLTATEQFIIENKIPDYRYEFQMLFGIRNDRQIELSQEHTMRVYVPFGEAWYPYFMRRLAERPANVWFMAKNLFS